MFRFSCFNAHIHSNKPKKTVQMSVEAMKKTLEDCSQTQALKDFETSSVLNSLDLKVQGGAIPSNSAGHVINSSSVHRGWKSVEINSNYIIESDREVSHAGHIKKSLSLGSGLDREGRVSVGNDSEDETDVGYSCDGSHDYKETVVPVGGRDPEISVTINYKEALLSDSLHVASDLVNNDSIFSIGDTQQSEKEAHENSDVHVSSEGARDSGDYTPRNPTVIVKSNSLPNMDSAGERSALTCLASHSRSSEDLTVLDSRQTEMVIHEVGTGVIPVGERGDRILDNEKSNCESPPEDGYDSYNCVGSAKYWIVPITDEVNAEEHLHREASACQWEEFPGKDLKMKRIEEWVIDQQHCGPLDETNDGLSNIDDHQVRRRTAVMDNVTSVRFDARATPGMEAAKKYISSLSAASTTAQLANHGLVVIPFLSAFVSLRSLNLSGNAIVRITAGALPRGLHNLNLSKNKISTIEGLRELTRLRVLDLSYNRIFRIGHGLASCSSLKELYLAGNKISEVEGLHRLLKLNVLDLRFNKISTAKGLGQLAANYNSVQAISLEGNPAQKNVGDEQLKKYLQGLLPLLAYFNRQSIKAGPLLDVADRSARLGITADRGHRSEHKTLRKGSHGASAHKTSFSSSIHGRRSPALASQKLPSKGKPGHLPPTGIKTAATTHRHNFHDFSSKLLSFRPDLSMRRSRSEGTLAAL
ncbi:uncharacterized protein LOC130791771 isoform X1 [Actinidia eriantha]|uniref:uncharacterized protein LOC130791771 isoform X1 n=2 Tax=Actinidia eriantha TaxID=165200 RepID=UPI0025868BD0|nr:uncharacterized protein LOC130791771 isoform X1 [Actinidia eriantha]